MKKFKVVVTQFIEVTLDETKFDEQFVEDFKASFFDFQTLEEHAMHLAQLRARGVNGEFIEGYGPVKDMGIKFKNIGQNEEIVPQ